MRLIDADALHKALKAKQKWVVRCGDKHNEGYTYDQVHFAIDDAPTIEPKKARWHKRNNVNFSPFDRSSEYEFTCGWCGGAVDHATNYCPNCGAKMERSEE